MKKIQVVIFFLSRVGSARDMQMNMIHVTSTPDLHYVKNMPATRLQVIRTTLLASVEVNYSFILDLCSYNCESSLYQNWYLFDWQARRQTPGPDFLEMEDAVLAQHAGELLLEVQESLLFPRVLGMICWQSSVC